MKLVDIDEVLETLKEKYPDGFSGEDFKSACESAPYYSTLDDFIDKHCDEISDVIEVFMELADILEDDGDIEFEDIDYDESDDETDEDEPDDEDDEYRSKFKHLWWTQQSGNMFIYTCSECKQVVDMQYPYCPMCGDQKIDEWM